MAISTRQVKNKRDSNGVLTGRPGTVYDVNIKYTAPNGEKKTYSKKGFPTKKEATQHEAEMKAKLHNPGQIASIASQRKQTVASYLNEWVESYARVNLRPSTYDGYKRTIANYITPYIGGVALNQLTPAMVDKMFQQIIDKGLKPSTAAGAKRVLSVALSHARKYRYIETNAAKDTLTKFGKSDKTPDPYTPEQVKALMQRVEGTVWEMPVILGGLYGMRRSEILGLRWRNVDLENNTFDVSEQLPFKVPPKTKVIEEMAPPKSNGRKLPITELARPFFLKQFAMQEAQREQAEKDGKPYYDNDLVVAKPDGSPISASWVSSQFGKLLEDLDRVKRPELPDRQGHRVLALRIALPELKRFIEVFLEREAGVPRVLHPAGSLGRADDAHFPHAHRVEQLRGLAHGIAVAAVQIGLHLDGKTVFDAQPNRAQRGLLRALMRAHPVMIAEAVKGYFHERDAAERPHAPERLPIDEVSVRVQLLDIHPARVDPLENIEEIPMEHRLAARDGEGVDAAVAGLIEKPVRLVHAPLAHERRVVGGVEAVDAVVVAFARDHPIHRRKIAVRAKARPTPVRQRFAAFGPSDKPVRKEFTGKRALFLVRQFAPPVALRQKRELLRLQSLGIALTFYVICIRDELP